MVISGEVTHQFSKKEAKTVLKLGSYFSAKQNATSIISTDKETTIYIRSNDDFTVSN